MIRSIHQPLAISALCAATALLAPLSAEAQAADRWEFTATLYGWFPDLSGSTTFPPGSGGSSIHVDVGTILDNLDFTFMGSLEARRGRWGLFTDVVYMDVSAGKSRTHSLAIGGVALPADVTVEVNLGLQGTIWSLGGSYRAVSTPTYALDLVGGARMLDIDQKLQWTLGGNVGSVALPDRTGKRQASQQNWDAFVGVKGRYAFGEGRKWFVPYYLDIGTGESDLTWQAMGGLGYSFGWGDVVGAWRYIGYEFKSGNALQDMNYSGPGIAAVFRW